VEIDRRQFGGGVRNWEWIKKGVPIRIELGRATLEKNSVTVSRRDQSVKEKAGHGNERIRFPAPRKILGSIQENFFLDFARAVPMRQSKATMNFRFSQDSLREKA